MDSYSDPLVGTIAILLGLTAAAFSVGPWAVPYQLRTVDAVRRRFGIRAARLLWLAVAIASLTSGVAILSGMRPPYVESEENAQFSGNQFSGNQFSGPQ